MANLVLLKKSMEDLEEDSVLAIMREIMNDGGGEAFRAMEICQAGMETVGNRFEEGEYFVGDLIFAGEMMTSAMEIIAPALKSGDGKNAGKLILCTVKDDLHDIGKNIVKAMLQAAGFDVVDLGIDASPSSIVDTAREQGISIIALSGVLTLSLDSMEKTIKAFKEAGMRDKVKIIIGGNPVSEEACKAIGADDWGHSPLKAVQACRNWSRV